MPKYCVTAIVSIPYIQLCPLCLHRVCLLVVIPQHTQFGCKDISSTKSIGLTNIQWSFEPSLWPWPWTQQPNLFTKLMGDRGVSTLKLSLVAKRSAVLKIQYSKNKSYFNICPWRWQHNLFAWHSGSRWCITIIRLATENIVQQTLISVTLWTFAVTLTVNAAKQHLSQDIRAYLCVPSKYV